MFQIVISRGRSNKALPKFWDVIAVEASTYEPFSDKLDTFIDDDKFELRPFCDCWTNLLFSVIATFLTSFGDLFIDLILPFWLDIVGVVTTELRIGNDVRCIPPVFPEVVASSIELWWLWLASVELFLFPSLLDAPLPDASERPLTLKFSAVLRRDGSWSYKMTYFIENRKTLSAVRYNTISIIKI